MSKRFPRAKWVLPEVINPPERICFQIQVPNEKYHIAAFLGALYNLTSAIFWGDDSAHTAVKVARVWQDIYDNISRQCVTEFINTYVGLEDDMPFFREICEDSICYLEFQCCPGEWVRLGRADQIPAGSSPSAGSPQPAAGGGTTKDCQTMQANNVFLIEAPVNTGDTLLIESSGSGNDNGEVQWRCPDGSTYFAGACNSSETRLDAGDPVPTANHMSLIININGTFHALVSGSPYTVPSGISNGQAFLQVNDSNIADNRGSYQICVTHTNNQAAEWSHTFDFALSDGGWIVPSGEGGAWVAGVGWIATIPTTQYQSFLRKIFTLPAGTTITHLEVQSSSTPAGTYQIYYNNPGLGPVDSGSLTTNPQTVVYSNVIPTNVISIDSVLANDASVIHKKIIIRGMGSDPF